MKPDQTVKRTVTRTGLADLAHTYMPHLNKPLVGVLIGSVLGILDGLTAWFTPAVRDYMVTIVLGSTLKGLVTGILMGFFARRVHSVVLGSLLGMSIGLGFAYLVARVPTDGQHYYWEIMLPGAIVGLIVGFATQRYGVSARGNSTEMQR